jgi:hypothetical protein
VVDYEPEEFVRLGGAAEKKLAVTLAECEEPGPRMLSVQVGLDCSPVKLCGVVGHLEGRWI